MAPVGIELEKKLQGCMPDDQWHEMKKFCQDVGIHLDEDSLEYGSLFLTLKYCFSVAWDASRKGIIHA